MLIVGLPGTTLRDAERAWLEAPQVSGVILFRRNFADLAQLQALVAELRALRDGTLLLCVDQEGGPVQRFRGEGITALPPLARLGALFERDPAAAVARAEEHGWQMASEMRALGMDLSFAPVLDLGRGNEAIGERALHARAQVVAELGAAYVRGMHLAGMAATGKHFPGHGSVRADTHVDTAVDARPLAALRAADLVPFTACIDAGLEAVMMAHVTYPEVDPRPAGCSRRWISEVLRGELGFGGVVISDDISMAAAAVIGGVAARIRAHRDAGCDLILACDPAVVPAALEATAGMAPLDVAGRRLLRGAAAPTWAQLLADPRHGAVAARLAQLEAPSVEGRA